MGLAEHLRHAFSHLDHGEEKTGRSARARCRSSSAAKSRHHEGQAARARAALFRNDRDERSPISVKARPSHGCPTGEYARRPSSSVGSRQDRRLREVRRPAAPHELLQRRRDTSLHEARTPKSRGPTASARLSPGRETTLSPERAPSKSLSLSRSYMRKDEQRGAWAADRRSRSVNRKSRAIADPALAIRNSSAGRGDRIRTCDPQTPSLMRYQAALRPDQGCAL